MREQKYANVLKEYEDSLGVEETEEKLSMTRELKFKDLHKKVSDDISSNVENVVDEDISELGDDVDEEMNQIVKKLEQNREDKNVRFDKTEETPKVSIQKDDDIYLTTSFKPPKFSQNVKKGAKVLLVIVLFFAVFLAIGYFAIYPIYNRYISSRPKVIFDSSVDYVSNYLKNIVERNFADNDTFYFDTNFKLKSNIDGLSGIDNNTYGLEFGVDPLKKISQVSLYLQEDNQKYGLNIIEKNGKEYYNYSTSNKYLEADIEEIDTEFYEIWSELLDYSDISKDDLIYLIDKENTIIKELIEDELVSQEKDEIEVLGKSISVVRNTYTLNKKDFRRLQKKYYEKIEEDDRLSEILKKMSDSSLIELEYKEPLKDNKEDYEIVFNIYTTNGTKVVGFDEEENGFRNLYYYCNNGNFEFHLSFTDDDDCLAGNDCVSSNQFIIDLLGEKKDTYTEVIVNYNGKKVATLNVKSFTDAKIDFEYVIDYEENKIKGDVLLFIDYNKKTFNLDLSVKVEEEYINLNLYICQKLDKDIGDIDEKNIVEYSDKLDEEESKKFFAELERKGLDASFEVWVNSWASLQDIFDDYDITENQGEPVPPQTA